MSMEDFHLVPSETPADNQVGQAEPQASPDATRETHVPSAEPAQLSLFIEEQPQAVAPVQPPQAAPLDPPWTLLDLLGFVSFAVVSLLVTEIGLVVVYSVLRPDTPREAIARQVLGQASWAIPLQSVWECFCFAFIYLLITKKYQQQFWRAIKWIKGTRPVGAYIGAGAILAVVTQAGARFFPSHKPLPIEELFSTTESAYLLTVFGICVAPFAEELVFRGFFYPVFERLWGFFAAVLVTALLFAGLHYQQLSGGWGELGAIFFVGLVLSYTRGKTRSLVPSFLMHLAYNSALFISLFITTDRFRDLKG
jgi:membrane protease YdiL (CAAX protease family)